jgi:serine/threonine-protein kinase
MNTTLPSEELALSAPYMIPTSGTILGGSYFIVRRLAEGGCGDVYLAAHERLACQVAIKILHPGLAGNARDVARLQQEAEIMSALRHPHIVQILDFDVTKQGVPFLVMELLEGRPLTQAIASGVPLEPRAGVHIVDQIAQALDAAHALGIVHLDLKPDNVILVSTDGRDDFVKVIDFGISRASWRARLVNEPLIVGTPEYMAPEQASGSTEEIGRRSDQFALAALSYWLLTGQEPFSGASAEALLQQVIHDEPRPPSQRAPILGLGVDAVIARGMSKRPIDRYPDVLSFADALREAVGVIAVDRRRVPRVKSSRAFPQLAPVAEVLAPVVEPPRRQSKGDGMPLMRRSGSRSVVLVLAAAAALVWFSPGTRTAAPVAWYHGGAKAQGAVATKTGPGHELQRSAEVPRL